MNALHFAVNGEGTLTINNITLEDAGAYECNAVNSAGTAKLNVHLQIVGEQMFMLCLVL